jgi:hypothetical protein
MQELHLLAAQPAQERNCAKVNSIPPNAETREERRAREQRPIESMIQRVDEKRRVNSGNSGHRSESDERLSGVIFDCLSAWGRTWRSLGARAATLVREF